MNTHTRKLQRQRGMTLIMGLIMLVVLTLLALTSFNLGKSNLQIVSNMQQREETVAAAREVIEETISSTNFFVTPDSVLQAPCKTENTRCVDTNGDGVDDITVQLLPKPACVKVQAIMNEDLDLRNEEDRECTVSQQPGSSGTEGSATGASSCANSVWEVNAVATDLVTEASVTVTQGVAVRIGRDEADTSCAK